LLLSFAEDDVAALVAAAVDDAAPPPPPPLRCRAALPPRRYATRRLMFRELLFVHAACRSHALPTRCAADAAMYVVACVAITR